MNLWLLLSALLVVLGLVGTLLPALPGPTLILAGIVLAAWAEGFEHIGAGILVVCVVLTLLSYAADWGAALLGARRVGASRLALAGAALGTLGGVLTGLVGLLFLPLIGAAAGQYLEERQAGRAAQVGLATWLGLLVGTAVKLALALTMTGLYVTALLVGRGG